MSKFLDLIEENTPDLNLDEKIAAKRAVQRCLMEKDIKCDADQKSDDVMIHLPDMFARDGAKKLAKVTNQVYLQVANDLKKSLKAIKKG